MLDKKRREEFKRYEMEKEHLRREKLKMLDEQHRKEEERRYQEMQKKHNDHPKLNHPVRNTHFQLLQCRQTSWHYRCKLTCTSVTLFCFTFCREAKISWKKFGRRKMDMIEKISIPKHSFSCMVSQLAIIHIIFVIRLMGDGYETEMLVV